jgi:Protein of unknown function (DUF3565)
MLRAKPVADRRLALGQRIKITHVDASMAVGGESSSRRVSAPSPGILLEAAGRRTSSALFQRLAPQFASSAEHFGLRSCYDVDMKRKIVGYHTGAENHWVAELECGHGQHVRDDPPWRERPWIRTAEGRASRLGHQLNCVRCDEFARKVAEAVIKKCRESLVAAYEDAGTSGLCAEGRWEIVALGDWAGIRS